MHVPRLELMLMMTEFCLMNKQHTCMLIVGVGVWLSGRPLKAIKGFDVDVEVLR